MMPAKPDGQVPKMRKGLTLSPGARVMGTEIAAGKGSGKTTFLTVLALEDFLKSYPQVIFDPLGTTSESLLFRISHFLTRVPPALHNRFWERVRYVDVGATDFVTPFPLYYELGSEPSLRDVAERFLTVVRLANPALTNAPIMGWPAMRRIGVYTGMILASLGYQITEAHSLLFDTLEWERSGRFAEAIKRCPEARPAVAFFRHEYLPTREAEKSRLITSFLDHIFPFTVDPQLRAVFSGASTPGIDWQIVERTGQTVLLDFRNVLEPETRRFAMLWIFSLLYEFIKRRGRSATPFGVIIDEFAALTQQVTAGVNPLAVLLDEFINQYMRNNNIWLTVAHQSIYQIDEQLRNTLLSLGNYVIGRAATMEEARVLADVLFAKDVFRVKHHRKVWGKVDPPPFPYRSSEYFTSAKLENPNFPYFVLDTEPEFMPLEEQLELFAQQITKLRLFDFLLRPAEREGQISSSVIPISIANVVQDRETGAYLFPNQPVVARLRSLLRAKSGIPIATLLAEQEARCHQRALQEPRDSGSLPAPEADSERKDPPIQRRERAS
jgi:hypothetical protein